MSVTQTFLDTLAATLRITRFEPPLAAIGQYLRFGIGSDPGLLRAVDPTLVSSALSGTIGGTIAGPLTAGLAIPVEVPVKLTVRWRATRLVSIPTLSPRTGGATGSARAVTGRGARGPTTPGPSDAGTGGRSRLAERFPVAFGDSEPSLSAPFAEAFQDQVLQAGEDFVAPDGVELPEVALIFAPTFAKMRIDRLPVTDTIHVYADVTLTAGSTQAATTLGPVKVLLPRLPLPRLLALFRYREFNLEIENGAPKKGQATLLVVPASSPLGSFDQLQTVLREVRSALTPLRAIQRFARLLLGVNFLSAALSRRPRVRYVLRNEIGDLHKVKLIVVKRWEDPWVNDAAFPEIGDAMDDLGLSGLSLDVPDVSIGGVSLPSPDIGGSPGNNADNDIYAGDRMSSLIFIGPPGAKAQCFINKNFKNGRLVVTTGPEAVVLMPSLAYPEGETTPETDPDGRAEVDPQPNPDGDFENRVSSLRL